MSPRRTLIRGGCVLTLGPKTPNFPQADVLIEDGRVVEVAPGLRARDAEQVDAASSIVMPGFVDAHRHAWKTLFRHGGAAGENGAAVPSAATYGRHYQPDDVYASTLLGLLSAAAAGITTVVDWSDIQLGTSYTEAALQAHADAGTRTVFVHASAAWTDRAADHGAALRSLASGGGTTLGPLSTMAAGPSDQWPSDLGQASAQWSVARELGLRIHAHAGTSPSDDGRVAELGGRALLGPDVTLVHCSNLSDVDLDAIAASGAGVALTPCSEMAHGLGAPPVQRLIDRGIRPGLGVDDELVAPGDLFAQMRAAQSLQHATLFDRKLAGKAGVPSLLSTRDVIRYATIDGAQAIGLGDLTGSLEPGKSADVIVLRTDRANISPVNDPIGAVAWGLDASNVDWVFVQGNALVRNGALTADVTRTRELAIAARQRVGAAAGELLDSRAGGST